MSSSPPLPPAVPDGGWPTPFMKGQQQQQQGQQQGHQHTDYSFTGRILLTAVVILAMATVVFVLLRLLLYRFVARGRGSLALGVRRSFGRRTARHGLAASALAALPVTTYRARTSDSDGPSFASGTPAGTGTSSAAVAAAECAVCLSELADGEKVRALPGCGHVFHVDCVDTWLRSRTTCPVCRAEVRPKATAAARPSPSPSPSPPPVVVTVEGAAAETRADARRTPVQGLGFGQPARAVG